MKHENFHATSEPGKYTGHFDKVKQTTVSEGTRADASDPTLRGMQYESYLKEYEDLCKEKRGLEADLAENFSRNAYTRAQEQVRKEHPPGQSLKAWLALRGKMDQQRFTKVNRINAINGRLADIKTRAQREKREFVQEQREQSGDTLPTQQRINLFHIMVDLFSQQCALLEEIRDLLKTRKE